ncbi:MAG: type IV pilus twitching motility protein PilT [Steroidobacteraceae bacterium]
MIRKARELGASDLHIEGGTPVVARVRGDLHAIAEPLGAAQVTQIAQHLLGQDPWGQFLARGSADVSVAAGGMRCRVSVYRTIRGVAIAVRLLTSAVSDLRSCNLHPDLHKLIDATTGLVVISGPTGSGKSTTLAALIEELNGTRAHHIITLESPLEYLFTNRRSFIRQREIPTHSPSFEQAIIDALRENPDVLVIGEMRDPEAIRLTLNAAETGHLVLATMHSATCAEALGRICMSFPAEIQGGVRAQLADCLVGVVCQRLEFLSARDLRAPLCELLLASSATRGTIRSGQFGQLGNVIQSSGEEGMWSFERYQRWMEQKIDWVRPPAPPPSERESIAVARAPKLPGTPSRAAVPASAAATATGAVSGSRTAPGDPPVEITIDEEVDLTELARRVEERAP